MESNKHPRKPRTYKINDARYKRAMRRAKKEKVSLATIVEDFVTAYSNGFNVVYQEVGNQTNQMRGYINGIPQ